MQLKEHFGVPVFLNESSTAAQNATAAQFNLDFNLLYTLYSLPNTVSGDYCARCTSHLSSLASTRAKSSC
jgi:hypothetical protein